MITSDPIGDWTWEITPDTGDIRPARAVEIAGAVWNILNRHELAIPMGKTGFSVRSVGDMRDVRVNANGLPFEEEPLRSGTALSSVVAQAESLEGDFLVSVRVQCPGFWREPGAKYRAEKLFVLQVDIWKGSLIVVTLETYSDAWLTMDTREREQAAVHAENAPRLAAALEEVSALLGCFPTPGDPNRHATPTETGFEDLRIEGPAYDDSWGTFDVPARARRLRSLLPPSEDEYPEVTEYPVRYFTIQRDGRTLGFIWASAADNAAGYEPRTAAGDDAFEAGAGWMLRLRDAHSRGFTAPEALDWVAQLPPQQEIGSIAEGAPQEAPSLDALEELSGRY
ncbi:hypothetical protein SNS2_2970 [Streptomyces netropsis]|nr:hypothetical protein SNS2_2970 [Streptomyces netropsis]